MSVGVYPAYVGVDPEDAIRESNEANNTMGRMLLVPADRSLLPLVSRH